jgi:hypothetical protein
MPGRHPGAVRLQKTIAVLADGVGHLEGWPRHRQWISRVRRAVSGAERVSASVCQGESSYREVCEAVALVRGTA